MNENAVRNIGRWLDSPVVSESDKESIRNMSEEKKDSSFFADIQFGTGGMRGILGPGTNCMNIFTVGKAMIALGQYLLETFKDAKERGVVISHDNRHMSREFTLLTANILNIQGIKTYIFNSLRPTPELSFAVRESNSIAGVMITASHNPKEYNGLKVYDQKGCQLTPAAIQPMLDKIAALPDELSCQVTPVSKVKGETIVLDKDIDDKYVEGVKKVQLNPNLDKKGFKIVYTPNHGTSYANAMRLFTELGYEIVPVQDQCTPDPDFTNVLSPNPEEEKAYVEPIELAKKVGAKLVVMTDPDGDRCGLAYLDRNGEYKRLTGNESAAVLLDYIFSERKAKGLLSNNGVIYDTIVSSDLERKIARNYGVGVETFLTGFKYIGDRIGYYEDKGEGPTFEFGYEESYGCLISPFVRDKDGLQAILMYSECALYYYHKGMTLGEAFEELEKKYGYHHAKTISIFFEGSEGLSKMNALMDSLRKNSPKEIGGSKVVTIYDCELSSITYEDGHKEALDLPKSNVLKYVLGDGSWIAVRPSGTEPKCKFYAEAISTRNENLEIKVEMLINKLLDFVGMKR